MYYGERFNSITHTVGAALAAVGGTLLIVMAARSGDIWKMVSFSVYGVTLLGLYVVSSLYHSLRGRAKDVLRQMDYCAIYLLIAGTYTPFTLVSLRGPWGWSLFGVVWGLALVGIVQEIWFAKGARILSLVIYVAMGWVGVIGASPLIAALGWDGFLWIAAGGVVYTVGIGFFVTDHKWRYGHGVWHLFVLGGSACHFGAVLLYVALRVEQVDINSDDLKTFITVIDSGTLSAASVHLGQTTSGVSRALSRLEDKLATSLITRTTRRMELTEEGHIFLERARAILSAMEEAEETIRIRRQQPAGRLCVDAASPFMLHCVVPHVAAFRALYPEIRLELSSNDQIADLIEHRTDIAIRIGALEDSTLHARALTASPLHVLASPGYLAQHGTPQAPEDLVRHSLLGFAQYEQGNQWPLRHASGNSLAITPTIAATSGETLRQLALAGQGVVCLADFMTGDDVASGRLVRVLEDSHTGYRQQIHAVYYRNTQLSQRISCFLDFLQQKL